LKSGEGDSRISVLWIVDSFWTDTALKWRRTIGKNFDFVVYMQSFDDEFYKGLFGERAIRLDWGADVLGLGTDHAERSIDLLRVGRQPASWDDDSETEQACDARHLRFSGRPAMTADADAMSSILASQYYSKTKFLVAHSNLAEAAYYTHPTKAYITARWTDALACGAVVAGVPPESDLHLLDWPEALLRLPNLDRDQGLDLIAEAVRSWTPDIARRNHLGALRRLDWRWRFQTLARALDLTLPNVSSQIEDIQSRMAALG
jgi:hypothetical protein